MNHRGIPDVVIPSIVWILAAIFVGFRLFARQQAERIGVGADDWTILVGLFLALGMALCVILWAAVGGGGWHSDELSSGQLGMELKVGKFLRPISLCCLASTAELVLPVILLRPNLLLLGKPDDQILHSAIVPAYLPRPSVSTDSVAGWSCSLRLACQRDPRGDISM